MRWRSPTAPSLPFRKACWAWRTCSSAAPHPFTQLSSTTTGGRPMGIRTGRQYLDKLNAMTPHVVIDGEVVSEKIAEHPAFRNVARSYARLFDMQHDPQYQEALTYASPSTGDLVNASFLVPRTVEDLQRRRRDISTWAESSNGFLA